MSGYAQRIRLFGKDYILPGSLEGGSAITTEEAYRNFDCSYAHLYEDGSIIRFGKQIGTREDIELTGIEVKIEAKINLEKFIMAIVDPEEWAREEQEKDGKK